MNRSLWFIAGAGAGIYGVIRGRRAAEAFTADGLQDRMTALFLGMRLFRDEVAQGAADREIELRERFAVVPDERSELTGSRWLLRSERSERPEVQARPTRREGS